MYKSINARLVMPIGWYSTEGKEQWVLQTQTAKPDDTEERSTVVTAKLPGSPMEAYLCVTSLIILPYGGGGRTRKGIKRSRRRVYI